jgi:hypothetical protein
MNARRLESVEDVMGDRLVGDVMDGRDRRRISPTDVLDNHNTPKLHMKSTVAGDPHSRGPRTRSS